MHFRKGTSCFSLKLDNDTSGEGGDNRPVNPMHVREGTSCFSLKWKNDWWDQMRKFRSRDGTGYF